ncbi:hypothetical protein PR202_gb20613 [Eleusine coracana subsp. coracana]|uniref:Uncharacterized protein n=1 Tax=Eleusine coracana subsp. coracana TaxID=191504 RepID=A0AAV5FB47_ELECO|nr:hypothetical protein PR202_gb20613 [Eleusine coracana subsp. coracana]
MAEGSSNSSRALLLAEPVGPIVDAMRGLELSQPLPLQLGSDGVEAFAVSEVARDWSQLQEDLLFHIFSRLDLPELVCAGPWQQHGHPA